MFLVGNTTHKGRNSVCNRYDKTYLEKLIAGKFRNHRMFERVLVLVK